MTCSRRNTKPLKTFQLLHIPALKKGIKLNHTYGVCIYLHTFNQLLSKEILTYGSCKQTQRGSTNRECVANKIAMLGTEKTAEAVGVDKSQISRWKRDWIPKFSMLLAVLEWGVVDDDMARLARQVASILTNKKRPAATERSEQIQMEF